MKYNKIFQLCDHVPETMTEQCKSFIKTYGKQALDMIAQKLDPSVSKHTLFLRLVIFYNILD